MKLWAIARSSADASAPATSTAAAGPGPDEATEVLSVAPAHPIESVSVVAWATYTATPAAGMVAAGRSSKPQTVSPSGPSKFASCSTGRPAGRGVVCRMQEGDASAEATASLGEEPTGWPFGLTGAPVAANEHVFDPAPMIDASGQSSIRVQPSGAVTLRPWIDTVRSPYGTVAIPVDGTWLVGLRSRAAPTPTRTTTAPIAAMAPPTAVATW